MQNHPAAAEIRSLVLSRGCYSAAENERIYEKWFAPAPRYLFRAVDAKHGLTRLRLADVGCAYGMNLIHCAPGSYGLEVEEPKVRFARSLGLPVHRRDVVDDDLSDLPLVEAVWCAAVLEHVNSPHILLRKLHQLLTPNGLAAIVVPTIPLWPPLVYLPRIGKYLRAYLSVDHVNAFTPATLRFTCERAGFRTIDVCPFYPWSLAWANHMPILRRIIGVVTFIGRAIPDWEYSPKSTRRVMRNTRGFHVAGRESQ